MNITKRDQILLLSMGLLIIVFVFFRFSYLPNREELKSLSITQKELQLEEKRLETVLDKTPNAMKDKEQKYTNLNKRLPTQDELVPLLTVLDDSCQKCKVPLTSMDYRGAQQKSASGAQTLVFTVITNGKVTQLFDFLAELETNQRLISVEDVSLTAAKAELQQDKTTAVETGPPVYYIAPPGMPEAKLQRVTFDVDAAKAAEEAASGSERPVAASFVPDCFEMKITINAYYSAQAESPQDPKKVDKTAQASENKL